jgi:hypothetical protein
LLKGKNMKDEMKTDPADTMRSEFDVIAAQTGYNLLVRVTDDGGKVFEIRREPIIAWRIETAIIPRGGDPEEAWSNVVPISSYGGTELLPDDAAVELPDKRCHIRTRSFDNAEEVRQYWAKRYQR